MVVGIACRGARVGLYVDVVRVHFSCKPGKLNLRTIFAGAGTNPLCLLRVVRAIGPTTAAHQCSVMTELETFVSGFRGVVARIVWRTFIVSVGKPCFFYLDWAGSIHPNSGHVFFEPERWLFFCFTVCNYLAWNIFLLNVSCLTAFNWGWLSLSLVQFASGWSSSKVRLGPLQISRL